MRRITLLLLGAMAIGMSACGPVASPSTTVPVEQPVTTERPAPITDGEHFGWVLVGESDGTIELHFDDAVVLTGDAAREAAVDAGVIAEGDDVPNDVFIRNDDETLVEVPLDEEAYIAMISADDVASKVEIDGADLLALFTDTYEGPAVYGVAAGEPIPMTIDVTDGTVVAAEAFYLP